MVKLFVFSGCEKGPDGRQKRGSEAKIGVCFRSALRFTSLQIALLRVIYPENSTNSVMVEAYWKIGERIVLQEQSGAERAAYGEAVLKELSIALTAEFGKGPSYSNLRNFRQFYLTYPEPAKSYTLRSKLIWSHNRLIMRVDALSSHRRRTRQRASSWRRQNSSNRARCHSASKLYSPGPTH